jgi:cytochrome oxidase assembly protein ShyY1
VDRSLFRGRYLLGHLVVLTLAGLFVLAGFWQLDRLHQVRTKNAVVRARMASAPIPMDQVLKLSARRPGDALYRRVVVTGHYDASRQALIQFRSYSGDPGDYLMTPVLMKNGSAVLVNRGWIPLSDALVTETQALDPPSGDVRVTGILFPSEEGGPAPTQAGVGVVEAVRIDLQKLAPALHRRLYSTYLQLTQQDPAQSGDYPVVLPVPHLDDGPHLSYAIQWFCFTAIGLIGWPILLRRSLRERATPPA